MSTRMLSRAAARNGMGKRMAIMLAAAGLVLGGIYGFDVFKGMMIKKFMASMSNPPQTVSTLRAEARDWQPRIRAVGTLRAVNGADLSLQVAGVVEAILFKSGDEVAAGTPLLRLAAADDLAKLRSLQAVAALARVNYQRDLKQFAVRAVAQATLDADDATVKNDEALVEQQQAIVNYKILKAPFAGRLGLRAVDLGQYLAAGTKVVTLQSLDPIFIDFFLPQQQIQEIAAGQAVSAEIDGAGGQGFAGKIAAIDPKLDPATRNFQVRALIDNPGHRLLPGMFATVSIVSGPPRRAIVLPQTAITFNSYGSTVFLVTQERDQEGKEQQVARQAFITTGAAEGDLIAVTKGLKEGDMVVTAGQLKLRNGTPLVINNAIQPPADPAPKPVDQ